METFLLTLEQVALLLIFIFLGYFFRKKDIITESGKSVLARLLVNLFAPAYGIASLSTQLTADRITEYVIYLAAGTVLTIFLVFLALPLAKAFGKNRLHQNILKYAFAFGNIGYFGYPVVDGIFGETVKATFILFCIPMSMGINTFGWQVLTEKVDEFGEKIKTERKFSENFRFLYSPPFIGSMLGLLIGLLPISLPSFATNVLSLAGNCQSATAMLLTGAVLANVPFKKLFASWRPYVIGIIRLLVLPLIVGVILVVINLCGVHGEVFVTIARLSIIAAAMPVGMNVVIYPESQGTDSTEGASTCFMSYILALGALPLVYMIMELVVPTFM